MRKEINLFLVLLLAGLILLPIAIYLVGDLVFGEYGGEGYSGFFLAILTELTKGTLTIWFLVLSPYIIWQLLRLTRLVLRAVSKR